MGIVTKRIVLTGGPCAGKTTIAEVLSRAFADRVVMLPEAASLLFSGGFPRWNEEDCVRSLQRAVYRVQLEIESSYQTRFADKLHILDRGTVDGAAYWPSGPKEFFGELGTQLETELKRYDQVIYLESAGREAYEINKRRNPSRTETWEEAQRLDDDTRALWVKHPKLTVVKNQCSFSEKIVAVLRIVEGELES